MVHAVVGEDHDRALGVEAAVEERLADPPRGIEGLVVGDRAPALAGALGQEDLLWPAAGPPDQPLADGPGVGAEGMRGA